MRYTPDYDFALPDGSDNVDVSVLNSNMVKIDSILADIYSRLPIPPQGSNINIYDRVDASTDTSGLWLDYDNVDHFKFKTVNDNLPYRDVNGNKNDIAAKYNSPFNYDIADGVVAQYTAGAGVVEYNGTTYVIGGFEVTPGGELITATNVDGVRSFDGTELTEVASTISGLSYSDYATAAPDLTNNYDEETFNSMIRYRQAFVYSNTIYVFETMTRADGYIADPGIFSIYSLNISGNTATASILYITLDYYGRSPSLSGNSLDSGVRCVIDSGTLYFVAVFDNNNQQGVAMVSVDLSDFTEIKTVLDIDTPISEAGYYVGTPGVQLLGISDNKFYVVVGTSDGQLDVIVSVSSDLQTVEFVWADSSYSPFLLNPTTIKLGDSLVVLGVRVDMMSYSMVYNLGLLIKNDEVNNVSTLYPLCYGNQIASHSGTNYIFTTPMTLDISTETVTVDNSGVTYQLASANKNNILICNGNFGHWFTLYDQNGDGIDYPFDYVLVPNATGDAYIEADTYLYDSTQQEWVKTGSDD